MSLLTCHDFGLAIVFLALFASCHEGHFVVPPLYVHPVWFVILFELLIKLQILTNLHQNIVSANTWIICGDTLIPFAASQMEGSNTKSNIDDSSFFCTSVFCFYAGKLRILIPRHHMNATFGQLLKQIAWGELYVNKVL